MKRSAIGLASAALAAALVASSPASAVEMNCGYNGGLHRCVYIPGWGYEHTPAYEYGPVGALGTGVEALATAPVLRAEGVTEPLVTGRSVAVPAAALVPGAVAGSGDYCATPVRTCRLIQPGSPGTGCSCRVPGGEARGFAK